MEKLWSPWRSAYIESFKQKKEGEHCVFCSSENSDMYSDECLIVHKGKYCFTMLNLFPYNSGHLLIIPYRHLSKYNELHQEEKMEVMELTGKTIEILERVIKPQGFNFGANLGKAAGAGIDEHIHFHVLPRWNGDTNFMPTIGNVKVISQDLLYTKNLLINEFNKI
jgi:ATP adenylyltransferase